MNICDCRYNVCITLVSFDDKNIISEVFIRSINQVLRVLMTTL